MERYIRVIRGVNFRPAPTTDSKPYGMLKQGTILQVLCDREGTWYEAVDLETGRTGFISSKEQYVESFVPEWLEKAAKVKHWIENQMRLGKEYLFGSTRFHEKTFDCSDLMQHAFHEVLDIKLGGNSRSQSGDGVGIGTGFDVLRSGDLIFFDTNGDGRINHVGMYVYPNLLLHTANKKDNITYVKYEEGSFYRRVTTGARRVILD